MSPWFVLVVLVVLIIVALALVKGKGTSGRVGFPYQPAKTLFSATERSFLAVLDQSIGQEYRVFGKVRVADIALVKPGLGKSAHQGALNRIAYKHFDFIICRATDLTVIYAVELNDKSHSSRRAQSRDELLLNVCKAINLPLLAVPAKQSYSVQEIRSQFLASISPSQVGGV